MFKKQVISTALIVISFLGYSQTITKTGGWLESAFVEWTPVSGAEKYNVYFTGQGVTNKKIDDQLIRSYGSNMRADVLGLQAGSYTIKVAPVISSIEQAGKTTSNITVLANDRSGFAFSNGRVPGAYNSNGTPKNGAVVLYISQNTKNTISLDVTGATANPCVGLQTILDGFKKGNDNRPLIVRFIGQISDLDYMIGGDLVVENSNNSSSYITLEGVGEDATADGWGIRLKNASNIEIRNIGTMNCNSSEGDNVGLQQGNDYIWVHNCDFFYGDAGSDADQVKGDGALDCKKSTYVTFSYNHFWDSGKCNLLGLSEGTTDGLFITYHHNWYDHSDSRHPRVRFYSAHVYNNYYDGNAKYGAGSTLGSSVFMEGNYFRNCKYPMLTSMQGSDVYDESKNANDYGNMPTFSSEDGGSIKAFDNYMEGQKRFVPYGASGYPNSSIDFDAYVVTNRNTQVPSSVKSAYGANAYNNFDVNSSVMYSYTAQSPQNAKASVMQYAGRMNGGDFKFTFDNAIDDDSYAVNTTLKSNLIAYQSKLVSIQGGGEVGGGDGGTNPIDPDPTDPPVAGDEIHNFTESGLASTFYTIVGSLSTSKGTVNYNGMMLTQCLKIESATSITFTTLGTGSITMIFNSDFSGRILVDGEEYSATNGILKITLATGNHSITKIDTANLYFMFTEVQTVGLFGDEENHISFYPNPVSDVLNIASNSKVENIQVFDLMGKLVENTSFQGFIDLSQLEKGTYILKVKTDIASYEEMIIKE